MDLLILKLAYLLKIKYILNILGKIRWILENPMRDFILFY